MSRLKFQGTCEQNSHSKPLNAILCRAYIKDPDVVKLPYGRSQDEPCSHQFGTGSAVAMATMSRTVVVNTRSLMKVLTGNSFINVAVTSGTALRLLCLLSLLWFLAEFQLVFVVGVSEEYGQTQ